MSPQKTLAVLAYHKVGDPPGGWHTWFYVSAEDFTAHLRYLTSNDWEILDVHGFLAALECPERAPDRGVLLTFDDGYRSNLLVAAPILQRFGAPAVVFVPTAFIAGTNAFDEGIEPQESICDWADLRVLDRGGVSVQSHGVSHRRLSELTDRQRRRELQRSKAALETALRKEVVLFSFPYGDNTSDADAVDDALAEAGYAAAFLYGADPNPPLLPNRYRIGRIAMGDGVDLPAALSPGAEASREMLSGPT
jgi:peptidoglycan/xylan/chitin deacetylase (PgdA/CDA1 family)